MPYYYGLYIPVKGATGAAANGVSSNSAGGGGDAIEHNSAESPYVFRVKGEALDVLKLHKDARLREFSTEDDAVKYAQTGYEVVQTRYADVKTSTAALEKAAFRAPTKQELIEFRKIIEAGDHDRVKSIIWDNPRYLVSSGDTPTTLKEGYRYNAMHVCSISKKPRIAELILQTVSDTKFVDLLTGKKNDLKMCKELCVNLLDYYLNIPEKGRSETPLHFAAKNGSVEMVEVLTSYPECKMTPNSEGLLPREIVCSRVPLVNHDVRKKIEQLLEERFYVPVLRSADNAVPPHIGQPFSANDPPNLNCDPLSPEVKIQAMAGPMNKDQAKKFCRRWKTPPRMGSNASSPLANNPYISPMKSRSINITPIGTPYVSSKINRSHDSSTPTLQRRALFNTTPQRSPAHNSLPREIEAVAEDEQADKQNGNHKLHPDEEVPQEIILTARTEIVLETNNNSEEQESNNVSLIAHTSDEVISQHPTPWHSRSHSMSMLKTALHSQSPSQQMRRNLFANYSEQLATADISSDTNISVSYERDGSVSAGFRERHIKISDTEKGLEVIGRVLAKEQNVEWREYWDFLNDFIDIGAPQGLEKMENYFAQRAKSEEMSKMIDVCKALEKVDFLKDGSGAQDARNGFNFERNRFESYAAATVPQSTTPYTCVEKSLQVFAKRMTKNIIHNIENVVSINDTLLSELKRLKSLICSFKEDARFLNVTFAKVHSRIGNLVSIYLENSQEVTHAVKLKIQSIIQNLLLTPGERREHIECVCSRILHMLERSTEQILPENLKTEDMCSKIWLQEKECDCQWETNLSRKTSRRNRMEARYRNHQQARQQEKSRKDSASLKAGNFDEWRNPISGNDSSDDAEDDIFWSDFGGSDSDDEEDVFLTPPESPSRISLIEETKDDGYRIFIFGNEPTKRDLDVLNAIFHVDIDKAKYPNIHSWKAAVLRYPSEEMDYFPSPAVVKKSQSFFLNTTSLDKELPQTPITKRQHNSATLLKAATSTPTTVIINTTAATPPSHAGQHTTKTQQTQQQLPTVKRLFMSPARNTTPKMATTITQQPFVTPLNKIKGLFSTYRDRVVRDDSPMSIASPAGFGGGERSSSDSSPLNISATE